MRVVLSPHLDDAVLSAFALLGPGARVVNVFAGVPPRGTLSLWDRLCGATDSGEQGEARRIEDEAVLTTLGVEVVHLDHLDALNRPDDPDPAALAASLAEQVAPGDDVYAPLGGGPKQNPDHRLVRDAALALPARVRLYADQPYCYKQGEWPPAIDPSTGEEPRWWPRLREQTSPLFALDDPAVRVLDGAERRAKRVAMEGYATQFMPLNRLLGRDKRSKGLLLREALYGVEATWEPIG